MYPFHQTVQQFFPGFDYQNPLPETRRRCDMRLGPENVVGHQQRAVTVYWALQQCNPENLGMDFGSPRGMTPWCVHVDIFGDGTPHPFYGGGPYVADVIGDASNPAWLERTFVKGTWPYIASNHSLEHMAVAGDDGIAKLLLIWIEYLRPGGVLALVIPDNAHFDVMASDKDHRHAWSAADFGPRVLDKVLSHGGLDLIGYDTLKNNFSFECILRKH